MANMLRYFPSIFIIIQMSFGNNYESFSPLLVRNLEFMIRLHSTTNTILQMDKKPNVDDLFLFLSNLTDSLDKRK